MTGGNISSNQVDVGIVPPNQRSCLACYFTLARNIKHFNNKILIAEFSKYACSVRPGET